jgi:signal transduction histidine kinase
VADGVQVQPSRTKLASGGSFWAELWLGLSVRGLLIVLVLFAGYELLERTLLADASIETLHRLHIVRGLSSSFVLATWAFLGIRRARLDRDRDLELLLGELERRVEERTARARDAESLVRHQEQLASLGVLAAGIAHDLGNPLGSLSSELELLEEEDDAALVRQSLGVLRKHVDRMARSLRDIVGFARRRGEEIGDVHLAEAVRDAVRLVAHGPRMRRIRIEVDVPEGLPPVRMVEDQLVMVLVNLLLNACDAMPEGGSIAITAREEERGVALSVRDEGVGMSPEVLARAKDALFTTKRSSGGTGLGLSVSDRLLQSMSGTLELASTLGAGTTVTIRLPVSEGPVSVRRGRNA